MGRMPFWTYLWPGLPMILATGSWLGLAWALAFAVVANLLILAFLWWPELLQPPVRSGLWVATAVFWGGAAVASSRTLRSLEAPDDPEGETSFAEATKSYLSGDWFGAERALGEILRRNPRDVEAGLMLATLWRHTGRIDEALQQLDRLELLEGSRKWVLEIHQERKQLEKAAKRPETEPEDEILEAKQAA